MVAAVVPEQQVILVILAIPVHPTLEKVVPELHQSIVMDLLCRSLMQVVVAVEYTWIQAPLK